MSTFSVQSCANLVIARFTRGSLENNNISTLFCQAYGSNMTDRNDSVVKEKPRVTFSNRLGKKVNRFISINHARHTVNFFVSLSYKFNCN